MAVRRRRPLVPPPYPRRNRYTPASSGQTALTPLSRSSLRLSAEAPYRFVAPPLPRESASLGFARTMRVHLELGSLSRIVTHFTVEMCYDFVTFCFFRFLPASPSASPGSLWPARGRTCRTASACRSSGPLWQPAGRRRLPGPGRSMARWQRSWNCR